MEWVGGGGVGCTWIIMSALDPGLVSSQLLGMLMLGQGPCWAKELDKKLLLQLYLFKDTRISGR